MTTIRRLPRLAASLWLSLAGAAGADSALTAAALEPAIDRWNYAHNITAGYRAKGSLFTGLPGDEGGGADRLGQIVLGFDTVAMGVRAGATPQSYRLERVTVTARVANDPAGLMDPFLTYDPSADPFDAVLAGGTDPDPGQPIELHGTGFRNGATALTYKEGAPPPGLGQPAVPGTPYSGPDGPTAYPLGFDEHGSPRDVTNNPSEGFDSYPWAAGWTGEVLPGEALPVDTVLAFDLALDLPGVRRYVQEGLSEGMLFFTLSSLQPAVFENGGGGEFAIFYMKESVEHDLFGDSAATLAVDYELAEETRIAMDVRYDVSSNEVSLVWNAEEGAVYEVFTSVDLESWTAIAEVPATDDGPLEFGSQPAGDDQRFYYVRRKSS